VLDLGWDEDWAAATRRRYQTQDHPQRRRLTSAVRSEKARDRPSLQRKRQVCDRRDLTETLGQRLGFDDRRHQRG